MNDSTRRAWILNEPRLNMLFRRSGLTLPEFLSRYRGFVDDWVRAVNLSLRASKRVPVRLGDVA